MRGDVGGKILEGGKGGRNCGLNVMNERKINKKYMKVYNATKNVRTHGEVLFVTNASQRIQ